MFSNIASGITTNNNAVLVNVNERYNRQKYLNCFALKKKRRNFVHHYSVRGHSTKVKVIIDLVFWSSRWFVLFTYKIYIYIILLPVLGIVRQMRKEYEHDFRPLYLQYKVIFFIYTSYEQNVATFV